MGCILAALQQSWWLLVHVQGQAVTCRQNMPDTSQLGPCIFMISLGGIASSDITCTDAGQDAGTSSAVCSACMGIATSVEEIKYVDSSYRNQESTPL